MSYICLGVVLALSCEIAVVALTRIGEARYSNDRSSAELYKKYCSSCHGKDGRGKTFKGKLTHARDFTDRAWQDDTSDERLFNSIMNGKRKMPSFSKKLSAAEIEALVSYIRTFK